MAILLHQNSRLAAINQLYIFKLTITNFAHLFYPRMVLLVKKGGLISKLRRRLTVQGDSETIDGGTIAAAVRKAASDKAEDVSVDELGCRSALSSCI